MSTSSPVISGTCPVRRDASPVSSELFAQIAMGSVVALSSGEQAEVRKGPHGEGNAWLQVAIRRGRDFVLQSVGVDALLSVIRLTQPGASPDRFFNARGLCKGCQ